jgi:hypothetical protein
MPRLSKIGAAALAAFGWTGGASVSASYLVVAGGGGASGSGAGGGGAGGFRTGTTSLNPTLSYTVTVGAGGAGAAPPFSSDPVNGSDSVFSTITSTGGGKGGRRATGSTGGSGGGGGALNTTFYNGGAGNTPSTSPSQGNNGGNAGGTNYVTGGGGGASAVGANGVTGQSGAGGAGTASSITGSSVTYAGGGGGGGVAAFLGTAANGGSGGAGGGGTGGTSDGQAGTAGTTNTGGGGGGGVAHNTDGAGGAGGSGIVIISYVGAQQFGGGVVTSVGGNTIHTFTTSGTLSPPSPLTAQYLIVAGGGGGTSGSAAGGGGGAGGYRTGTGLTIDTNSNYAIVVGAGGAAGYGDDNHNGSPGTSSSFLAVTSAGGGYGAGGDSATPPTPNTPGGAGGSGGGGRFAGVGGAGNTPSTSPSQGNNGGASSNASNRGAGGGGGASAVGADGTSSIGGNGGAGTANSISGTATYYAGGGGGGTCTGSSNSTGGSGGGGNGGAQNGTQATAGTANTGGGGGGNGTYNVYGAAGGSGVVIIAYPGSTQQMAGGTVTISGGNVIHTFTSSGYLTPIKYASRSLRFRSSASGYLNRTFSTPTSSTIWTWSAWVKRGGLTGTYRLFGASTTTHLTFNSSDQLNLTLNGTSAATTTAVYRDPSSWYHIVYQQNGSAQTIYVNNVSVATGTTTAAIFNTAIAHQLGAANTTNYFDGYMTEVNFIDGAALTPSSFGTFNSFGVWQPITYGGSYGTNGFYLTFGNNTSTTTLGYDTSPQGNNWTTNNISVTAGTTYDSMTDVPTLTSATVANYATLNPLFVGTSSYLSGGNLNASISAANTSVVGTFQIPSSGKWYWEYQITTIAGSSAPMGGIATTATNSPAVFYRTDGTKIVDGTNTAYGATYTTTDTIGVAVDVGGGTITFYKNNTSQGAITYASSAFYPALRSNVATDVFNINFGQRPFTYTPPSGFVALNTYNLSTPAIPNGAVYMAATTYSGTNTTQSIANTVNGTNFQPDFVWFKSRATTYAHALFDSVRGVTKGLETQATTAEQTSSAGNDLAAFTSTGFTVGAPQNWNSPNNSGSNPVAWQWKANGTGVSNTSGSITSTVSANTTAGFSIVTYTGTNTAATVGHGLGVAPSMIIVKQRNSAVENWLTYHSSLTNPTTSYLYLNSTAAQATTASYWNGGPTSSVFGIGAYSGINASAGTYVAYCFAAVTGYSAFGSYTGNGSTDGPFVFLGFRPRFTLIKRTDAIANWRIHDTARDTYNVASKTLYPNLTNAETSAASEYWDILSNGIKLRTSDAESNASGGTYIYMAFAENPFKYSNAR